MAYQARRHSVYTEDFELAEEDGTVVHTLHVNLDPDSMIYQISEKHVELAKAFQRVQQMKEIQEEATEYLEGGQASAELQALGEAVIHLMEAVFGEDNAKLILDFYGGRYLEMCREVVPFITRVVLPQVRKMAQESRKQLRKEYDRKRR